VWYKKYQAEHGGVQDQEELRQRWATTFSTPRKRKTRLSLENDLRLITKDEDMCRRER
jgi:hypothetical protein